MRMLGRVEGDLVSLGFLERDLDRVAGLLHADPLALHEERQRHRDEATPCRADGDRVPLALEDSLTADDVAAVATKLARMDAKTPWTAETLALIGKHPRTAASKLAAKVGRETPEFKADVVKLKKLGLTQSFEVGYEIAPRGRAYLDAARRRPKR